MIFLTIISLAIDLPTINTATIKFPEKRLVKVIEINGLNDKEKYSF